MDLNPGDARRPRSARARGAPPRGHAHGYGARVTSGECR